MSNKRQSRAADPVADRRAVIARMSREREAEKESWKTYRGMIHVEIKAPDKRVARRALDGIRPLAHWPDAEVELRREGPEPV